MNHIIIKCNLDRGCIDYFTHRTMTWSQDTVYQDQQSSTGWQWRRASVQPLGMPVLKSNSRLEIWLLKLCLLRGRARRFVDFCLGLENRLRGGEPQQVSQVNYEVSPRDIGCIKGEMPVLI